MKAQSARLFFALWPDAAARDFIVRRSRTLQADLGLGGRAVPPERLHLTLHFLGNAVPTAEEPVLRNAARTVRTTPFDLDLDRAGTFPGRGRPCWLGPSRPPSPLIELHAQLGDRLRAAGIRVTGEPFVPHVTVLRGAGRQIPHTAIEPVRCTFRGFSLVRSRLDRQPVEYEVVEFFPPDQD